MAIRHWYNIYLECSEMEQKHPHFIMCVSFFLSFLIYFFISIVVLCRVVIFILSSPSSVLLVAMKLFFLHLCLYILTCISYFVWIFCLKDFVNTHDMLFELLGEEHPKEYVHNLVLYLDSRRSNPVTMLKINRTSLLSLVLLRLLYPPDPWNLPGTAVFSGFQSPRGALKCTE